MNELTFIERGDVFTNTLIVAQGTGNEHESVVLHLKKYRRDFEELGAIRFTDLKSGNPLGGRPTRVYLLNEMQATLLVTYLDNTEIVRKFKLELVKQFFAMRRLLLERQSPPWQQVRLETKTVRLQETNTIKVLVEYARAQGSTHADKLYMNYTKLTNQLAACSDRDLAPLQTLSTVMVLERIAAGIIQQEMAKSTHYKTIYQIAKAQLTTLVQVWSAPRQIA